MISPKNKLRMCFLFIVAATIVGGTIYYYYTGAVVDQWGQGTLITIIPRGILW